MKAIFLLPQIVFSPRGGWVGGYTNSVINLAAEMQHDCDITLIAGVARWDTSGIENLKEHLPKVDCRFFRMRSKPTSLQYFIEFCLRSFGLSMLMRLQKVQVDVVYGHSGFPGYALASWLCSVSFGSIVAHCLYCPHSDRFQHQKAGKLYRWIVRKSLRRVPNIVAISDNVGSSFLSGNLRGFESYSVIPPAIPNSLFEEPLNSGVTLREGEIEKKKTVIGFVGHHKKEKGLDLAIESVAMLKEKHNLTLKILLSGGESQERGSELVQQMAEQSGLTDQLSILNSVKNIRDFMSGIDFLSVPFRGTQGPSDYPMVLLEAMALGRIVVATSVGAVPEVVRHNETGFLASTPDASLIADSLHDALETDSHQRNKIAESARSAMQVFRARNVADETLKLLERIT